MISVYFSLSVTKFLQRSAILSLSCSLLAIRKYIKKNCLVKKIRSCPKPKNIKSGQLNTTIRKSNKVTLMTAYILGTPTNSITRRPKKHGT